MYLVQSFSHIERQDQSFDIEVEAFFDPGFLGSSDEPAREAEVSEVEAFRKVNGKRVRVPLYAEEETYLIKQIISEQSQLQDEQEPEFEYDDLPDYP